jgi:hypothetical protein
VRLRPHRESKPPSHPRGGESRPNPKRQKLLGQALSASRILALKSVKDDNDTQESNFLANTYNIRTYNIMINNKDMFKEAMIHLSTSELYAIGSNFVLATLVGDAIPYYELALTRSKGRDIPAYVAASREYGLALFGQSSFQDVTKARKSYIDALSLLSDKNNFLDPSAYAIDLAELATLEASFGDWKCSSDDLNIANSVFDKLIPQASQLLQAKNYFNNAVAVKIKGPSQPSNGCSYSVPIISWL